MKTLEGIYTNGHIRLKEDIKLVENLTVYVFIPDEERQTGIDANRNRRIQEAKRAARKRIQQTESTSRANCTP